MAKVKEEIFWKYLKANNCSYALTAAAIHEIEGIKITRQAVRDRALKKPDKLKEANEFIIERAEQKMHKLSNEAESEVVQFNATKFILERKARHKGWGEHQEVEIKKEVIDAKKISLSDVDPDLLLQIKEQQKDNQFNREIPVDDEE